MSSIIVSREYQDAIKNEDYITLCQLVSNMTKSDIQIVNIGIEMEKSKVSEIFRGNNDLIKIFSKKCHEYNIYTDLFIRYLSNNNIKSITTLWNIENGKLINLDYFVETVDINSLSYLSLSFLVNIPEVKEALKTKKSEDIQKSIDYHSKIVSILSDVINV